MVKPIMATLMTSNRIIKARRLVLNPIPFILISPEMLSAIVHTQGVVLGSTYIPLEMAYHDILNMRAHFHITSPVPYAAMRKLYPHSRPDVLVVAEGGTPYWEVLDFLKVRFRFLASQFPAVVFGYKGESYQPQILRDAGIGSVVNVEKFGVPALQATADACRWHARIPSKCAVKALEQILRHVQ